MKKKIILGIHPGHNATVGLMVNGKIVSLVHEERFSRIKNHLGFPYKCLEYIFKENKLTPEDLDLVVVVGTNIRSQMFDLISIGGVGSLEFHNKLNWKKIVPKSLIKKYSKFKWDKKEGLISEMYSERVGVPVEKIIFLDHHETHALSTALNIKPKTLVFTLDGEGDGLCATVSVFDNNEMNRLSQTKDEHSLGLLYGAVTEYLGMKKNEHEYKVMGLAPYAKGGRIKEVKKIFDELIWLNEDSLSFETKMDMRSVLPYLYDVLKKYRFDEISAAIQFTVEELVTEWIKRWIKKVGISDIALAGGVFMNVKAGMLIGDLKEVKSMFITPSAGDESLVLGCLFYGAKKLNQKSGKLKSLCLGPKYSIKEIEKAIIEKGIDSNWEYRVEYYKDIEKKIVSLLVKGKIVARMKGRCEWGARALGNRSILADASKKDVVKEINELIKNRDFWMPFAASILKEKSNKYLINPKRFFNPWMILAFYTKEKAEKDLSAALHPYDLTTRPQMVTKEFNLEYHRLIKMFEKKTGMSGLLNTSFNIHGEPIVCSPEDAIHTFVDSGLKYLAMENYLLSKRELK